MRVIACSLQAARHSTRLASAYDISHTSAKTYRIRCHHTFIFRNVAYDDHVPLTAPRIKIEGAKVHPCAATHLLVYVERGCLSFVVYGVVGIINATLHSLVAHVNGITTTFLYVWLIAYVFVVLVG